MEVYFFLWAYFLGPDKVWTLMDMPRTVSPPQLDPRGPQIGPEGEKKG